MNDRYVALVRQAIFHVLDDASPRTMGLEWDFNDDEDRVEFADKVVEWLVTHTLQPQTHAKDDAKSQVSHTTERCEHDLVTVRDIDLPEYCWYMRCRKCGAECNDPAELEEPQRIKCPDCPDGQLWDRKGPTDDVCQTCRGTAFVWQ